MRIEKKKPNKKSYIKSHNISFKPGEQGLMLFLVLILPVGFISSIIFHAWRQGWQIYSWQVPITLFTLFISLLLIFFAVLIYLEHHEFDNISEMLKPIFFEIVGICCFIAFLLIPFKEVYHCEGNICKEQEYAIIRTRDTWNSPFIVNDTCEIIGMNKYCDRMTNSLLYLTVVIAYQWDKNNLAKFRQANGKPIKLFSYDATAIWAFIIIGLVGCLTIYFNKPKIFYTILAIILLRILYIIFI